MMALSSLESLTARTLMMEAMESGRLAESMAILESLKTNGPFRYDIVEAFIQRLSARISYENFINKGLAAWRPIRQTGLSMFDDPCSFDVAADGTKAQCPLEPIVRVETKCKHGHESRIFCCRIHFAALLVDEGTFCSKCSNDGNRSHKCPIIWDWEKLVKKAGR